MHRTAGKFLKKMLSRGLCFTKFFRIEHCTTAMYSTHTIMYSVVVLTLHVLLCYVYDDTGCVTASTKVALLPITRSCNI
jgi:hypothetical protein